MQAIVCEMCGSNDLVKQDGLFVCQNCGTKYTVEEAKKLMGTVKIDNSDSIKNYIDLGQKANKAKNGKSAASYADKALEIDPQNVEAWLIKMYAIENDSTVGDARLQEMISAGNNALEYASDEEERNIVEEKVYGHFLDRANSLINISTSKLSDSYEIRQTYRNLSGGDASDFCANIDSGYCAIWEGLTQDGLRLATLVPPEVLGRHIGLCRKTRLVGEGYLRESSAYDDRLRCYGRYLLQSSINTRNSIANDLKHKAEKGEKTYKNVTMKKYWDEHPERKQELDQKKADSNRRINELNVTISQLPIMQEKKKLESEILEAEKDLRFTGFFKFKEKGEKREVVRALKEQLKQTEKSLDAQVGEIKKEIERFESIINKVDKELSGEK